MRDSRVRPHDVLQMANEILRILRGDSSPSGRPFQNTHENRCRITKGAEKGLLMRVEEIPPILRLRTIYLILPFWIVLFVSLSSHIEFNDLGHYIRSGDEILATKTVMSRDVFTYTFPELPYVNSGWLSQVFFAVFYNAGGLTLLILVRSLLLVLTMAIVYHLIWQKTGDYKSSLVFFVYVVALGLTNWAIRPQIFVLPIFAYLYSHLCRRRALGGFFFIVFSLLMVLWVNLHSSFAIGLMVVGIYLFGEVMEAYQNKRSMRGVIQDARVRGLFVFFLLLVGVTVINPYGFRIWEDVWANASASQVRSFEWAHTTLSDYDGYAFIFSLVLAAVILRLSKRKVEIVEAVLLFAFLLLGFKAVRMIMWWGIVSGPILSAHFASIAAFRNRFPVGTKKGAAEVESVVLNVAFATVLVSVLVMALPWFRPYHPVKSQRNLVDPKENPVALVDFIEKSGLKGNMYNNVNWGSYIIWRLWPHYRVFADTRLHLIPQEIWKDYVEVDEGLADWGKVLNKYDISFLVLNKTDNKRAIGYIGKSPNWETVYEDSVGIVFQRIGEIDGHGPRTPP